MRGGADLLLLNLPHTATVVFGGDLPLLVCSRSRTRACIVIGVEGVTSMLDRRLHGE